MAHTHQIPSLAVEVVEVAFLRTDKGADADIGNPRSAVEVPEAAVRASAKKSHHSRSRDHGAYKEDTARPGRRARRLHLYGLFALSTPILELSSSLQAILPPGVCNYSCVSSHPREIPTALDC